MVVGVVEGAGVGVWPGVGVAAGFVGVEAAGVDTTGVGEGLEGVWAAGLDGVGVVATALDEGAGVGVVGVGAGVGVATGLEDPEAAEEDAAFFAFRSSLLFLL